MLVAGLERQQVELMRKQCANNEAPTEREQHEPAAGNLFCCFFFFFLVFFFFLSFFVSFWSTVTGASLGQRCTLEQTQTTHTQTRLGNGAQETHARTL